MPNAKITWGSSSSHSMTLEIGRRGLITSYRQERYMNQAASGKLEFINLFGIQEMDVDFYITTDNYRPAVAFWSWAGQGKPFKYANSASKTGSTTIASAISANATSIVLTSGNSFAASDEILLRSDSSTAIFEVVKISAISSNSVTLTTGTKYAYTAGAIFRHKGYWGSCVMLDTTFNPQQNDATIYNHRMKFTENL